MFVHSYFLVPIPTVNLCKQGNYTHIYSQHCTTNLTTQCNISSKEHVQEFDLLRLAYLNQLRSSLPLTFFFLPFFLILMLSLVCTHIWEQFQISVFSSQRSFAVGPISDSSYTHQRVTGPFLTSNNHFQFRQHVLRDTLLDN